MFRPVPLVITGTTDADMNIFKAHLPHIEPWYCRKGLQAQMFQLSRYCTNNDIMSKPKSEQTKNTIDLQNASMGTSFDQNRAA